MSGVGNQLMNPSKRAHEPIHVRGRSKADIPDYIESEAVDRALWRIAEYVCQDFVTHWFQNLSDDSDFPNDVRDMLGQPRELE